jgi:hypothetical protein
MAFLDIIWWVCWASIALGIVVCLLGVYSFSTIDQGLDDGESAAAFPLFIALIAILVGPAAFILLLFLIFHLSGDYFAFSFADTIKWIIYIAFWGQVAVSTVWGLISLSRLVLRRIRNWQRH